MQRNSQAVKRGLAWVMAALCLLALWQVWQRAGGPAPPTLPETTDVGNDVLPPEARATVRAISRGGPFPHRQDGAVFQNRERLLPVRPRGHYREYTVPTPGSRDRGARRIVTGGEPPATWYYTADHYRSFRGFTPPPGDLR